MTLILFVAFLLIHDKARPELNEWFKGLQSGKGPCCSHADGVTIQDSDWESNNGHYRVRIPRLPPQFISPDMIWIDVPDEAVIKQPNLTGHTIVWPIYSGASVGVRCFMPGTMI